MFCFRTTNGVINKVHERALRVLLNDHESDFEKLFHINNDVCNHHRNIQTLLIEIFKIKKGFAPPKMGLASKGEIIFTKLEIFKNLRHKKNCIFWFRNYQL